MKNHDAEEWLKNHDAEEWLKNHDAEEWLKNHSILGPLPNRSGIFHGAEDSTEVDGPREARSARRAQ